jgi:chaperonin GroES
MDKIKLLGDRVLVEIGKEETKTASGLLISKDKESNDVHDGIIVAVGSGKRDDNGIYHPINEIKTGDKVLFNYGFRVTIESKPFLLVNLADVLVVLETDNKVE